MIEGVQNELNEKNDALSHLLGGSPVGKVRGPRKRRNVNSGGDDEEESEESEIARENVKKKENAIKQRSLKGKRSRKSGLC